METWFWVLGWFLSILTMVVNGFVIFLVCSKRQLRTKTNAFVVSLAVADFGVGMLAVPSRFFCGHPTESTPPLKEGLFVIVVRVFIIYTSGTNLVSLVLERYVAVVKPLKYLTSRLRFFSGMGPRSCSFQRLTSHLIAFHYPRHRNLIQFGCC